MVIEFKAVEAVDSLVALLQAAEYSAIHAWEQDQAFHPGVFRGLILLARFASERAGEEFKRLIMAAELGRKLNESRDELRHVTTDRDTFRDGLHELKTQFDQLQQQLTQVTAERDAAIRQRDGLREKLEEIDPAAVSCATAGEPIGAVDLSSLPPSEWTSWELDQTIEGIDGARIVLSEDNLGDWPKLYRQGFRRKEPATEPYEWQVGDEIRCEWAGWTQPVAYRDAAGWLAIEGNGWFPQFEWERQGWRLHRKASDIQQVERYTAVTEPISDSFGADGEGVVE